MGIFVTVIIHIFFKSICKSSSIVFFLQVRADKIFVMNKGNIKLSGTPREIFKEVDLLKEYQLDVPQVTEIAHRLRQKGMNLPECVLTVDELVEALATGDRG